MLFQVPEHMGNLRNVIETDRNIPTKRLSSLEKNFIGRKILRQVQRENVKEKDITLY